MLPKLPVLDSWISTGSVADFVATILKLGAARASAYVCFANVHMVVEAQHDAQFRQILREAALVAPDGSPVAAAVHWLNPRSAPQARVAGMDLLPVLLEAAARSGQSVYFYGTTNEVLTAMVARARRELPTLRIAGTHSPPFRALTPEEDAAEVAAINAADPDLLFVALGCPRQEKWMAAHQGRIRACMLGVGQAFPVYAGLERRLPLWARRLWLEWAYRLWLEPRRLWRRYLVTNTRFVYLLTRRTLANLAGRPVAQSAA
ncbi:N-acetylglucosaminyldiphosphoundecaprenol N-acetyl-beta-D-mannosaminyltransferase [Hymenobacter luteus]|uniref:N-acetylglucosaminyldiphosphoundecaprenol N-acetyl-beta-D-mannosaminyltransferase n=2 Tax=Hymenobacter TaxID=89966 RepID=A0A7W9SZD9_9BACT|nr:MULTISPECIES: WecB/TagA/CpsF family glycosyltransferase [Hymenobacter]MBB4601066.1 N-acetylglucosaminyldiphosphoundecaprenol N-acetyl-beta-D-mannosaminyltransferase [Hymenobacter latericoloratus]MBB6058727.1 N-acetylglucosaminyldiphosphoundecaprenol N-acetyl-beta-D-mannosaminyltransferase [Hymenobacter luteus]